MSRFGAFADRGLRKYVAALREMQQQGFSIDVLLDVAFGEQGYQRTAASERAAIASLYRESLGDFAAPARRGDEIASVFREAIGRYHRHLGQRMGAVEREIIISMDAALIAVTGDAVMLRRQVLSTVRAFVECCEESGMPDDTHVQPVRDAYGDLCTLWGFTLVDGNPVPA